MFAQLEFDVSEGRHQSSLDNRLINQFSANSDDAALEQVADSAATREALDWLARQPELLERIQPRAARYLAYLVESVSERGLPTEIALIPIIESTLDP